jgi:hypothetical protein
MTDSSLPMTIEFHHDGREPLDAPQPVPMRKACPEWLQAMPAAIPEAMRRPEDVSHLTMRACAPLIEAMTTGYALLWPCTTTIMLVDRKPDASFDVRYNPAHPPILDSIPPRQSLGMPSAAVPILKLISPWIIRTPEGTSCLITPLFNRPEIQVIPFAAVVETDRYFAPIHFPFLMVPPKSGIIEIERGTPFAQITPFRRDDWVGIRGSGDARASAATRSILAGESEGAYSRRIRVRRQFR